MKYNKIKLVKRKDLYNYFLPALNRYLLKEWVDYIWKFCEGFGEVQNNSKYNYIRRTDGTYLLDEWVDFADDFFQGFGVVKKAGKWNYVKQDGTYLLDDWVDCASVFNSSGFGMVEKDEKTYKIDKEGKLYEI